MSDTGVRIRPRLGIATLAICGALTGAADHERGPRSVRVSCDPVSERDRPALDARVDTGEYALSLVATSGLSAGSAVQGRLWLRPTSALDTSPRPLHRALARDAAHIPLYGATVVDFAGVGAPPLPAPGGSAPDPRSFDPRRPGVVVTHDTGGSPPVARWTVLIGTTANIRETACGPDGPCPPRPADGVGVGLTVRKIERGAFAGGWAVVGRTDPGGFFCAVPVRYYQGPARRRHVP
jgi:hypothetical protein